MGALPSSSQNLQFFPSAIHSFLWFTVHRKGLFWLSPCNEWLRFVWRSCPVKSPQKYCCGDCDSAGSTGCVWTLLAYNERLRAQGVLYTAYKRCPQWTTRATKERKELTCRLGGGYIPDPSSSFHSCDTVSPALCTRASIRIISWVSTSLKDTHTQLEQNHHRVKNNILFKHPPSSFLAICNPPPPHNNKNH